MKLCKKCNEMKSYNEFNKCAAMKDGYKNTCKACDVATVKEWREKNRDKHNETRRKHYKKNSEKIKERNYKYKEENKEYYLNYGKAYYKKNSEKMKADRKEYVKKLKSTPEGKALLKSYVYKRIKTASKNGAGYTAQEWRECLEFFSYCDAYTGEPLNDDISIDHVIPISRGGTNNINNLVPCKKNINSSKNAQDMREWYKLQPFYSKKRERKINKWIELKTQIKLF